MPRFFESWPPPQNKWEPWRPIYQGVDYCRGHFSLPRLIKAHALRIDLQAPGVEVLVQPPVPGLTNKTVAHYATDFMREHGLQIAFSADSFLPFAHWPGEITDPTGIAISEGALLSQPVSNLHALGISRNGHAQITRNQYDLTTAWQAVGGMLITLEHGTNSAERLGMDAASVSGISADGRFLYWLIVDGRQKGYSEGATPEETAEMMKQLGADMALNMDGGSVVTLGFARRWIGYRVANRPCHPYLTGVQRPIGSMVGVRARPLP